jgi:hypothetical protein
MQPAFSSCWRRAVLSTLDGLTLPDRFGDQTRNACDGNGLVLTGYAFDLFRGVNATSDATMCADTGNLNKQ